MLLYKKRRREEFFIIIIKRCGLKNKKNTSYTMKIIINILFIKKKEVRRKKTIIYSRSVKEKRSLDNNIKRRSQVCNMHPVNAKLCLKDAVDISRRVTIRVTS